MNRFGNKVFGNGKRYKLDYICRKCIFIENKKHKQSIKELVSEKGGGSRCYTY